MNRESGLLGVSGTTADMKTLLERRARDEAAAVAVAMFCYQARKQVGALAAALGGLDTLVFTGGIGERAAPVRAEICDGLAHLGVRLDGAQRGPRRSAQRPGQRLHGARRADRRGPHDRAAQPGGPVRGTVRGDTVISQSEAWAALRSSTTGRCGTSI